MAAFRLSVFGLVIMMIYSMNFVSSRPLTTSSTFFDVTNYGAVGDGFHDDTDAFVKAWEATCESSSGSATMVVPSMTFFLQPVVFEGPCNSEHVNIEIKGTIIAPANPNDWKFKSGDYKKWIHIKHVDGLSVYGTGTINGHGSNWWNMKSKHHKAPTAIEIEHSDNVRVSDITMRNNPRVHLVLSYITGLQISNIIVDSPENSPNSDGIHISNSQNVVINNCTIATGDDCISIVSGSSNVRVSNIVCGPGHGISIGSLGKDGATDEVEYVHVSDVVFRGSTNGARIKTWQGGSGFARHILFERVLSHGSYNPIIIDQFYCDKEDCHNQASAVKVSNVTFREFIGVPQGEVGVRLDCSSAVGCKDIVLENVDIRRQDGSEVEYSINNVHGRVQGKLIPHVPLSD